MKKIVRTTESRAIRRSAVAFRQWRGKRPTGEHGYELMKWDYEDRDMRLAWDAAVAWLLSQNAEREPHRVAARKQKKEGTK
jgi:hypothetical protein